MSGTEMLIIGPPPIPVGHSLSYGSAPASACLAALLPALAAEARVVLLLEEPEALSWSPPSGVDVVGSAAYAASPALQAMPHVYELGDHPAHAGPWRAARRGGGLVVLHDLSLHRLVEAETLGTGDTGAYIEACAEEAGMAGATIARGRLRGYDLALRHALLPLTAALLARAQGVVVHGRFAAARLRPPPGLPVQVGCRAVAIPAAPPSPTLRSAARAALRLPAEAPILLVPATIDDPLTAISVLRHFRTRSPRAHLVTDGPCPALERAAALRGYDDAVRAGAGTAGYGLAAADLLLDLTPVEIGGATAMLDAALAEGLPVVAYSHSPAAMLPNNIARCVPFSDNAAPELAQAAAALLQDAWKGAVVSSQARLYLRQHRSPGRAALAYLRGVHAMTVN